MQYRLWSGMSRIIYALTKLSLTERRALFVKSCVSLIIFADCRLGLSRTVPETLSEKAYTAFKRGIVPGVFRPGPQCPKLCACRTTDRCASILIAAIPQPGQRSKFSMTFMNSAPPRRMRLWRARSLRSASRETLTEMGNLAQAGCRSRTKAHSSRPIRNSIWESPS